ncbi:hypothetical protein JCM10207_007708 [Rhodosporidiobolus poonsookiae]
MAFELNEPSSGADGSPPPYDQVVESSSLAPPTSHSACKPTAPLLQVRQNGVPYLIHVETFAERFIRWYDPQLPIRNIKRSSDTPPWSLWLESYYGMYHPETWRILEADHEADKEYYYELRAWRERRSSEGASQEELAHSSREQLEVLTRLLRRFERLYCLHFVREQYLARHRIDKPVSMSDAEWDATVVKTRLEYEDLPFCTIPQHSVWPLPCPFPSSPSTPARTRLTAISAFSELQLQPYIVPGIDSPFLRVLKPKRDEDRSPPPPFEQSTAVGQP